MGQHLGALKVLLNLTEGEGEVLRYAHLQKPLLHVDGIPFTDKDHKCINITKLEFQKEFISIAYSLSDEFF